MSIKLSGGIGIGVLGGPSSLNLSDLHDVGITSPQTGQYLRYNGATLEWNNSFINTDVFDLLIPNSGVEIEPAIGDKIIFSLGDITPSSVFTTGTVIGSNLSGTNTGDQTITLGGDVTGSGTGSIVTTLATVNPNVGSFGSASNSVSFTVNEKGLITAASSTPIVIAETQITDGSILARVGSAETITGNWTFNNPVSVAAPATGSQAATKQYVDDLVSGVSWKQAAIVSTTANIALTGLQTIDGVAVVAGNRVLVKNQTAQAQNGVYVAATGAWTRSTDMDSTTPVNEFDSAAVFVNQGTTQSGTGWTQISTVTTVGTDPIVFAQFNGASSITAGNGLTKTGNIIDVVGSSGRIVSNVDNIDLATVTNSGTGTFSKLNVDTYGRVTGTSAVVAADITPLVNSTYVLKAGDTMTGALGIVGGATGVGGEQTMSLSSSNQATIPAFISSGSSSGTLQIAGGPLALAGSARGGQIDFLGGGVGGYLAFRTGVTTGGVSQPERMRIDGSGNVGVGTTSPLSALHVLAAPATSLTLTRNVDINSSGAAGTLMEMGALVGTTPTIGVSIAGVLADANSGVMIFNTRLSGTMGERVRIDASGYVGIGTNAPQRLLNIKGSGDLFRLESTNARGTGQNLMTFYDPAGRKGYFGYGSGANDTFVISNEMTDNMVFLNAGAERMRIDQNGLVGIGKIPQASFGALQVQGVIEQRGGGPGYRAGVILEGGSSGVGDASPALTFSCNTNNGAIYTTRLGGYGGNMVFATQDTAGTMNERMRIDDSGRVAIGTTTPGGVLRVNGGPNLGLLIDSTYNFSSANTAIKINGDPNTPGGYIQQTPASGGLALSSGATYYGGGPWRTDTNVQASGGVAIISCEPTGTITFKTNTGVGANTNFTPAVRMTISRVGNVIHTFNYGGTFVSAGSVIDLNTILPGNAGTGFAVGARIDVTGSENGDVNAGYSTWLVLRRSGGFSLSKGAEVLFGNAHGQPILSISGNNLVITNGAGSSIGGWLLTFTIFAP